jgi:hypothetical protein
MRLSMCSKLEGGLSNVTRQWNNNSERSYYCCRESQQTRRVINFAQLPMNTVMDSASAPKPGIHCIDRLTLEMCRSDICRKFHLSVPFETCDTKSERYVLALWMPRSRHNWRGLSSGGAIQNVRGNEWGEWLIVASKSCELSQSQVKNETDNILRFRDCPTNAHLSFTHKNGNRVKSRKMKLQQEKRDDDREWSTSSELFSW